eukprot:GHVT01045775.1.p1 GENE.GHVT01045775.1~~GHVT01045775.1.p1  ORF type:complete len:130 (-),score=14.67 GHVT01045775.1:641-1030(-)
MASRRLVPSAITAWTSPFRRSPLLASQRMLPVRATPKFEQKPLGSYPISSEHELLWKNRSAMPGGAIYSSFSAFQMKTAYPHFHQAYARLWCKFSAAWYWWMVPAFIHYLIVKYMFFLSQEETRKKFWY